MTSAVLATSDGQVLFARGQVRLVRYSVAEYEATVLTVCEEARVADVSAALTLVSSEAALFDAVSGENGEAVMIFYK